MRRELSIWTWASMKPGRMNGPAAAGEAGEVDDEGPAAGEGWEVAAEVEPSVVRGERPFEGTVELRSGSPV
jgi:hypothetical protein